MDIRQSSNWGSYLSQIGWKIEKIGNGSHAFIRPIPLFGRSVIKIQHPQNPLDFAKIDKIAKEHKALFVLLEPQGLKYHEPSFIKDGYRPSKTSLTHTSTVYLDLTQSEPKLFSSFSENAKRNIKKAEKNNLIIKKIFLKDEKNDGEFRKFYDLLSNLTKLKKFYVPGYGEFHKKMQAFKDNSVILFAYTPRHSEPVAAVWLGILEDTAVYMNTGITEEGYRQLANYLLVWEALKLAKKQGLKIFDFEGVYDPRFPQHRQSWQKFSEFKKRFHGQVVEYPKPWIKYYSLPFKLFHLCGQIFSR